MQKIAVHMQVKPIESTLKAFAYLNKPPHLPQICTAFELKVRKSQNIFFFLSSIPPKSQQTVLVSNKNKLFITSNRP